MASRSRKPVESAESVASASESVASASVNASAESELRDLFSSLFAIPESPKESVKDVIMSEPESPTIAPLDLYTTAAKMISCHANRVRAVIPMCGSIVYGCELVDNFLSIETSNDWHTPKERILQISEKRFKKLDFIKRDVMKDKLWIAFTDEKLPKLLEMYEHFKGKGGKDAIACETYSEQFINGIRSTMDGYLCNTSESVAYLVRNKCWTKQMCFTVALQIAAYKCPSVHANKNVRAKYFSAKGFKFKDLNWDNVKYACFKVVGEIRKTDYVPESARISWNALRPKDDAETPKGLVSGEIVDVDVTDELI